MEKENIKLGKISESELVELFGSPSQKKSYAEKGKFTSSYKSSLFKKINKYCKIKPLSKKNGEQMYKITEVYENPLPANFDKMSSSLYQYITPLILNKLINGHDKNNKIEITVGKWAREIHMVNHNYNLIKYNRDGAEKEFVLPLDTIDEFYDKTDHAINWYISKALGYLKSAGLIIWRENYRLNREVHDETSTIDDKGNVYVDITIENQEATEDDMQFYSECVAIADKEAGIKNDGERYYSKKSKVFSEALRRELYKRKIKTVYKTYEAYYVHLDKCQQVLNNFGEFNEKQLISDFNREFSNLLIGNAEKRYDKNPDGYKNYMDKNNYSIDFQDLCEITIDDKTEYLGHRVTAKSISDDYTLQVTASKIIKE